MILLWHTSIWMCLNNHLMRAIKTFNPYLRGVLKYNFFFNAILGFMAILVEMKTQLLRSTGWIEMNKYLPLWNLHRPLSICFCSPEWLTNLRWSPVPGCSIWSFRCKYLIFFFFFYLCYKSVWTAASFLKETRQFSVGKKRGVKWISFTLMGHF